jgi:hypothetical protein
VRGRTIGKGKVAPVLNQLTTMYGGMVV